MTDISKWNTIAAGYTDWLDSQKDNKGFAFNLSLTNAIIKRLPNNSDLSILDLGCGDGSLLNQINNYSKCLGIDGAENMIKIAKTKYPNLSNSFLVGDITKPFPFENNAFDIIICNMVLMDLQNIETTITETYRILKRNGVFIFTINHPSFSYSRHHMSVPGKRYIDNFHYEKSLDVSFDSACNNYHRPIQFYIQQLLTANLTINGFEEISIDSNFKKFNEYYLTANALLIESIKIC
jgi:ubiquinone/menaquinone biosynthesis C-methylase UbiE